MVDGAIDEHIVFDGITKKYGKTTVLSAVDFRIAAGERVALLGQNGAGKTTALRIALGLAKADSGTVRVMGVEPHRSEALVRLGYCPQVTSAPGVLRVRELVRMVADLKGADEPTHLYGRFGISSLLQRQVGALSIGQLRIVITLLAFVGDPELVVLDEPTAALDSEHKYIIWQHVAEYCQAGGTLLLASHDFSEVTQLADRALLLHRGRLVKDGPVTDIVALSDVTAVEVVGSIPVDLAGVSRVLNTPTRTILLTRDPEKVVHGVQREGHRQVLSRQPTLEEVFLTMGDAES